MVTTTTPETFDNELVAFNPIPIPVLEMGIWPLANEPLVLPVTTAIEVNIEEGCLGKILDDVGVEVYLRERYLGDSIVTSHITLVAGTYSYTGTASTKSAAPSVAVVV
jgi:hypothetical protein